MKYKYIIMTFESTHMAIKTEKLLSGVDIDVLPTPRQISTSCGISIKIPFDSLDIIKEKMGNNFGNLNKIYGATQNNNEIIFEEI